MHHEIIVVGGGISGLSCAWRLMQAGRDVLLLEADDEPGGNIRTSVEQGFRVERGPHNFMASADDVFALVDELGLSDQVVATSEAAEVRFIVRGGKMRTMPGGAWSFLTSDLLSFGSKMTLATEPFRTRRGEPGDTAKDFFERRFGPEAARILAGGFINGVYAGDPAQLSAPAAFPLFWGFEQETGSMVRGMMRHLNRKKAARKALGDAAPPKRKGLFSLQKGLGQLTGSIAQRLDDRYIGSCPLRSLRREGRRFVLGCEGRELSADQVVLAVPPPQAAPLLAGLDERMSALLLGIPMARVASVQLGYQEHQDAIPDAYGFLAPRGEGVRTLGILFPSRLFTGRAPGQGDLLAAFTAGILDTQAFELDDEALVDFVRGDLYKLTGLSADPDLIKIGRYPNGIPQLVCGHLERVAELGQRARRLGGLSLAGNYLHGVGIKDAVRSGFEAAAALMGTQAQEARA